MSHPVLNQLNRRYATKKFDTEKKIPEEQFDILLESLRMSPSSSWLQGRWFVVVENNETRKKLKPYSRDQDQITDASHLIVLCRTLDMTTDQVNAYLQSISDTRGVPLETLTWFKQMMLSFVEGKSDEEMAERLTKQVYIAQWFLLSTCAQMEIDACPMEWFDPKKYDEILELEKDGLTSCVVVPVWYRHADDHHAAFKKVRFDKEKVIFVK